MLVVQKYGGTSVATPEKIISAARRILTAKREGHKVVVVVSALGHTTDELLALASKVSSQPSEREIDMLISTGEQVAVALLAMALHELGCPAISFTAMQVGIVTDSSHTRAKIIRIGTRKIRKELSKGKVVIVAGFQGVNLKEDITTLGRGGSNLTAVALAAVLKAQVCEMNTDVDGVYTADPRIVPGARKLDRISYEAMLELASLGVQVLQPRSVQFAQKYNVPIHVRSSFSQKNGTRITREVKTMEKEAISGVTATKNEAKICIRGVPDKPGIAARIFTDIARKGINVDMIVQNVGEDGLADISFTIFASDLTRTMQLTEKIRRQMKAKKVEADSDIAKISVVGVGMRSHSGVAAKMFKTLAQSGVNIEMISTSEIKISCLVRKHLADKAVRAIHRAFKLGKKSEGSE